MSSKPLIRVEKLGKKYFINESLMNDRHNLLEEIANWCRNPLKEKRVSKEFWALQDVNFSINPGDTVGLIGSNGSGKSTLLKILARVTWPTLGKVEICGKVSALLEVGTGFHLELSGRENIFLSGAMLGMNKSEIVKSFDEIVAFSEVEQFLDTPVKKYSSGMFLRLAFSVMAHLRSDILIIDEVLAVGDTSFQEKCIQKMDSIVKDGRTIIFVSHQLSKVRLICQETIWIKEGKLHAMGNTEQVLTKYEQENHLSMKEV